MAYHDGGTSLKFISEMLQDGFLCLGIYGT